MQTKRYAFLLTPLLLLTLLLSACGGTSTPTSGTGSTGSDTTPAAADTTPAAGTDTGTTPAAGGTGMIEKLDFGGFGGGANPQVNYNPYLFANNLTEWPYEPLMRINSYNCQAVPWLATDYKWADDQATSLVYTIRDGVKWSDGQPFTADDVVFTFNMLKAQPAFDQQGVWQLLDNVSASGNQVTFKFKQSAANMFTRISGILIVPKHVFEKEADPVKFTNPDPVGTGPFLPTSFNTQQLVLTKNENYWQADKINVKQLVYHNSGAGGQVDQLNLAQGKYDTNAMFVPNIQQVYVSQDPEHNHYWYPPGGEIALGMNLTKAPFNDVEFRKALAYAINRDDISNKAEYGYVKPASQTGLVVPGQKDWLDPSIPDMGVFPYDPKQAADILDKAGYKKDGSGKLLGKDGKPIEFTFLVQNGWTDWIQASQIVQQNLQALGMTVNVQTPAPENVESQRLLGNFDMTFAVHGGSCNMYDNYHDYFYSKSSAPIGTKATTNWIRWEDPASDTLIDQLAQSPDLEAQKKAVLGLQKILVEQFPTVPLWYGARWFQYSTKHAVGWPNEKDDYAGPTDTAIIMTHLKPAQ